MTHFVTLRVAGRSKKAGLAQSRLTNASKRFSFIFCLVKKFYFYAENVKNANISMQVSSTASLEAAFIL